MALYLKSKTAIIATGARWRNVGVPGEARIQKQRCNLLYTL